MFILLHAFIAKVDQMRIRKIRDAIPSVPGLLEFLRRNPDSTEFSMCPCVCVCVCACMCALMGGWVGIGLHVCTCMQYVNLNCCKIYIYILI